MCLTSTLPRGAQKSTLFFLLILLHARRISLQTKRKLRVKEEQ